MSASNRNRFGTFRTLAFWVVVVVVIAAVFGLRFRQLGQTEALASIRSVQETEGIPVETAPVIRADLDTWVTLAGTVEGEVQYPIISQNALRVVDIPVQEGQRIEAGDVILRLAAEAPSPMYNSLDRSRAAYDQALADVKRLRNLHAQGAVSDADLEAAETQLKVQESSLQDAERSTFLRAAQSGVVSAILVDEGETASAGEALAWIVDTQNVKLVFAAGSAQARALEVGQLVELADQEGPAAQGRISRLDLMADPQSHLLEGEALLANPDGRFVPGLLLSFRARTNHRPQALTLPREALAGEAGSPAVWTVDRSREGGNPVAHRVPVQVGVRSRDRVEILSGLRDGDDVVVFGQTLLQDGSPVKVLERSGE